MRSIFEATDYRDYIFAYYEARKAEMPLYSYRMLGNKLGLDASQLFRILQKEQHLPPRCVPAAKELLELQGRAAEYFDLLIAAARSRQKAKKEELLDKAFALRDVQRRQITAEEIKFLSHWWIAAVRAFLEVSDGIVNPTLIAQSLIPPISEAQVLEAINVLKKLNMVKKMASERLQLSEAHLSVSGPAKAQAIRQFQKQVIELSARALDEIDVDQRDISTLTMAMDHECLQDIKELSREFRRQIQKRVEESESADRIVQMNIAIFPLAQGESKNES